MNIKTDDDDQLQFETFGATLGQTKIQNNKKI